MANFANPELDNYFRRIILPSGTAADPSIVFANDLSQGFYYDVAAGMIKSVGFDGGTGSGVSAIHSDGNPDLTGNVHLVSGTNITLSQVGQNITINAASGSGTINSGTPNFITYYSGATTLDSSGAIQITGLDIGLPEDQILEWTVGGVMGVNTYYITANSTGYGNGHSLDLGIDNAVRLAIDITGILIPDDSGLKNTAGTAGIFIGGASSPLDAVELFSNSCDLALDDSNSAMILSAASGGLTAFIKLGSNSADGSANGTVTIQSLGAALGNPGDTHANNCAQFDHSVTAGETRFILYDVDSGALQRVTVGAADSGGTGFKVLRIPN